MSSKSRKINLNDTIGDTVVKMSEGNPGAVVALIKLIKDTGAIDPQSEHGAFTPILLLDVYEIYGTDIYVLFNDKCGSDSRKMLVLLRAVQLGCMDLERLVELSKDQSWQVNLNDDEYAEIERQVCNRLEKFQRPPKDNH